MSRASELARLLESEVEDANLFRNEAAAELRFLERLNAELVEALTLMVRTHDEPAETLLQEVREQQWLDKARAALTSATKEQQK